MVIVMIRGFYAAMSGANAAQIKLDTLANNIANTETTGYKAQTASFADTLYANTNQNIHIGSGARQIGNSIRFSQGMREQTGGAYDFYIEGSGFFAVQNKNGDTYYTRNGCFSLSYEDGKSYLVTADGQYVLDNNNQMIEIIDDADSVLPGVFEFANPYALQLVGDSNFAATELSGNAEFTEKSTVVGGCLEASIVDMVSEMVKMIEAQRAFQFNSRMIQTSDELKKTVNNLR
jgi:flagellar basal-body rod protein FlgG